MPFINKKTAFTILNDMEKGKCTGSCRQGWLKNISYALKTHTNPLKLTDIERKELENKIKGVKNRKAKILPIILPKKYLERKSPPFPANDYCGKTKKGNDGKLYLSKPNKNNICRWVLVK